MIVDAFLYAGERDFLDLRMCELQDTVDLFVAVEGTLTFQGKPRVVSTDLPKQSNFVHLVVNDFPEAKPHNAWKREMHQRNAILRGLQGLYDDDIILVSDIDEIPDSTLIPRSLMPLEIYRFKQSLYLYNFNNHVTNDNSAQLGWNNTFVCRLDDLRRYYPQGIRNKTDNIYFIEGGWHFSWMTNPFDKMNSYSHVELLEMQGTLEQRIQERWGYQFEYVEGIAHLPKCVQANLERYEKYLCHDSVRLV